MPHKNRGSESDGRYERRVGRLPLFEPCPDCGKLRYLNRKAARNGARRAHPGESMSVYRCGEYWHIGHTPTAIKLGYKERAR